jgi:ubiquinol-cytochrome c reductase cytochrome c subunit
MRTVRLLENVLAKLIAIAALGACLAVSPLSIAAGSAEKGKAAYVKHGCWQCHGYEGQGGVAGPKLAPDPWPLEGLSDFLRNTRGAMPPYPVAILPDGDLADIHAYLQSVPKPKDYRNIPQLSQ